ncbi:MAG: pyruvate kinase [Chloroflexales bacterium]|nr:pyruvate kinase [Chloroflexales bacterium]
MTQPLPSKKTKIVCTIGPASQSPEVLQQLIAEGMNIARVNFSHGDVATHRVAIANVRAAASALGASVAIFGDLPGPKMRVGEIAGGPVELRRGQAFTLHSDPLVGDATRASHSFPKLPQVVRPGDAIYLNDGYIQLEVERVEGQEVHCRVLVGGPLSSKKGLNMPGTDLGISAFTERDRELLRFAAEQRLDGVSQSFVESAADIEAVRRAAAELSYDPFIIAKIERAGALPNLDAILQRADGIMVARGDLGVEIPTEQVAFAQKQMIARANRVGKPVITATHMLESMISNRRPTRAEATDVANAILDGTDCVMLSGETAVGAFPQDAVATMARIAAVAEANRPGSVLGRLLQAQIDRSTLSLEDLVALNTYLSTQTISPSVVFAPTDSGRTARQIARFHLAQWVIAFARDEGTCRKLQLSYGVRRAGTGQRVCHLVELLAQAQGISLSS